MEWIDDNHIKGEMSDEEFMEKVDEIAKTRDIRRYGRDGNIVVYEERFEYKGIPYIIKILRYFQIGVRLHEMRGLNKIGKFAVLEYSEEIAELAKFLNELPSEFTGIYDWLWRDTLHFGQEDWTLKQMVEQMHREAKECIDALPEIKRRLEEKFTSVIKRLNELYSKFGITEATG